MFKACTAPSLCAVVLAAAALQPALAQYNPQATNPYSAGTQSAYDPPPAPASRARRNDAYQPADTGPGLGTLNSQGSSSGPAPYSSGAVAQANPNDGYAPRYGEPTRPYGSGDTGAGSGNYPPPYNGPQTYNGPGSGGSSNDAYRPAPGGQPVYGRDQGNYAGQRDVGGSQGGYGQPYGQSGDRAGDRDGDRRYEDRGYDDRGYDNRGPGPRVDDRRNDGTYSNDDVVTAGGRFFGTASQGLAKIVENLFKRQGRPNGYILGEEGGGAFVAGLRYGEGTLYTRDAGTRKVYWQGPSLGFDAGGAASKVMVLVYNLHSVNEIYERFGGIDGSAYFVGGLGMTLLTRDHITLAPIRTGVGLRLGANVGYLKFTPKATWNPF